MRIGYARVSTLDQNLDLQEDALKAAGCEKVYTDRTGWTKAERSEPVGTFGEVPLSSILAGSWLVSGPMLLGLLG